MQKSINTVNGLVAYMKQQFIIFFIFLQTLILDMIRKDFMKSRGYLGEYSAVIFSTLYNSEFPCRCPEIFRTLL